MTLGRPGRRPRCGLLLLVAARGPFRTRRRLGTGKKPLPRPLHQPPETLERPTPMDPQQPEPVSYLCGGNPLAPLSLHLMIGFVIEHRNREGLTLLVDDFIYQNRNKVYNRRCVLPCVGVLLFAQSGLFYLYIQPSC